MNLQDIVCEETLSNSTSHSSINYKPRLNACIICGKCEICNLYVYTKSHKCEEGYPMTEQSLTRKYYPNKINNIDLYVQDKIMWTVIVDFSERFEYSICSMCYNDANSKYYCITHVLHKYFIIFFFIQ